MRPRCPQCGGQPSYEEGGTYVCMMGGHRWPINGAKPIIVYKRSEEEDMESKKTPSGKVGICVNCEREKFIADGAGLCSSCHNAVKGISKDSVAYTAALADAKKHLTNNPTRRGRGTVAKKLSPESIQKAKKNVRALSIKHNGGDHDLAGAIAELTINRDNLLLKADKLTRAIALLS
jgi:hypothetical protein